MKLARALVVLSLASAGIAVAAPAHAAEQDATTASVTSYSGGTFRIDDLDNFVPGIVISGTSDGDDAKLDVRCYYKAGGSGFNDVGEVTTGADGSWSDIFNTVNTVDYLPPCVLRAIPEVTSSDGTSVAPFPTDATVFPGQLIELSSEQTIKYDGGSLSGNVPYDYNIGIGGRLGYIGSSGAGACDADDMVLMNADTTVAKSAMFCHGSLNSDNSFTAADGSLANQRGGLIVDGVAAQAPGAQFDVQPHLATPAPALTFSVTEDPATGNAVIVESDPLVRCTNPAYPQSTGSCGNPVPVGVRLDRTITDSAQGRVESIRDTYVSTDGKAHTVDAQYRTEPNKDGNGVGFTLPTDSVEQLHDPGDVVTGLPAGPGTVYIDRDPTQAASAASPAASLTWSSAPTSVTFGAADTDGKSYQLFDDFVRSVPAGGTTTFTQTYAVGESVAEVQGAAAAAAASIAPSLAITSAGGTVGARRQTVTGTFSGANGVPDVVRAGSFSAPVAENGSFSLPVTLAPGGQDFAVMGVDSVGAVAGGAVSYDYVQPVTLGAAKPVLTKKKSVVTGISARITVACARLGTSCREALTVLAGRTKVGTATVTVPAGTSRVVTVKLSRAALKAYLADKKPKKKKAYKVTVSGSYVDPDGSKPYVATARNLSF